MVTFFQATPAFLPFATGVNMPAPWSLVLSPWMQLSLSPRSVLTVSNAALAPGASGRHALILDHPDLEKLGSVLEYKRATICVLNGFTNQVPLNLSFQSGFQYYLFNYGPATLYILGHVDGDEPDLRVIPQRESTTAQYQTEALQQSVGTSQKTSFAPSSAGAATATRSVKTEYMSPTMPSTPNPPATNPPSTNRPQATQKTAPPARPFRHSHATPAPLQGVLPGHSQVGTASSRPQPLPASSTAHAFAVGSAHRDSAATTAGAPVHRSTTSTPSSSKPSPPLLTGLSWPDRTWRTSQRVESMVTYQETRIGQGQPIAKGDNVTVGINVYQRVGGDKRDVFSLQDRKGFQLVLGTGSIPEILEVNLQGMKPAGYRRLFIPAQVAALFFDIRADLEADLAVFRRARVT
ncbi:hypothetical protein EV714DRAFT_277784 [Schizophyllum commune]